LNERDDRQATAQPGLFPKEETSRPPVPVPPRRAIADGTERRLDPGQVTLERISRGIFTAVLAALSFAGLLIVMLSASPTRLGVALLLVGWASLIVGLAALAWFWPPLSHRHVSYRLDGDGIRIRRGVVWRSVTSVPHTRVQHTDVSQGPLERSFDLATLIIHTAGTQNASVSLSGLRHADALRIRDHLIDVDGRDDD
jgi:membrane protein YdbS with pleckstrin-like domain